MSRLLAGSTSTVIPIVRMPRVRPASSRSQNIQNHIPHRCINRYALLPPEWRMAGISTPSTRTSARAAPGIRISSFHSTSPNHGGPLIPLLAAALKASTTFEIMRTAGRIALTLFPVIWMTNVKSRRKMKIAEIQGVPASEEKKKAVLQGIKHRTIFLHVLLLVPFTLFWATIIASLEQTPLTGRWRMIILSPEEEDEIAAQLAGPGWYQAVGEILSQDGPPRIIAPSDWRFAWVNETLRRLEATIPVLVKERELCPQWLESGPDSLPMPPPAEFPLRPRPRASEYLRWLCEKITCERNIKPVAHTIAGPPYSLLVVDKPDASNAFSYGFGPDGGGGVVVYSGFLDDIMSRLPPETSVTPPVEETSWLSRLLGIFSSSPSPPRHPVPSAEQTSELAILLAHELAHLVLSHHLETLSSTTVIVPGTLSIAADIIRVLIFPVTMLFGPFVNDAVAQLGKIGSGELLKVGEHCTSMKQEIEADVVSARLLAHAGFDAREAVKFWENRSAVKAECAHMESEPEVRTQSLARRIMGAGHPVNEVRVDRLKEELVRWEEERLAALSRSQATKRVS